METLSQATPLKVLNAAVSYKVVSGTEARTLILTLGGVSGCASGDTKESRRVGSAPPTLAWGFTVQGAEATGLPPIL